MAIMKQNMMIHGSVKQAVYVAESGRGHVCKKLVPYRYATIDHIVPFSEGGDNSKTNLRIAHRRCNMQRSNTGPGQLRLAEDGDKDHVLNVYKVRRLDPRRRRPHVGLPEYLEKAEVEALIRAGETPQARLLMLTQWRAGLRVSEALALEAADIALDGDRPTLRVRRGKGSKPRLVPLHPELAAAYRSALNYGAPARGPICTVARSTAWRWVKTALVRAQELGAIPPGRRVATHTLRHSAARHWLASGVPINVVSRWLGHASLQTTLIYLAILPDPLGDMDRVP